MMMASPSLSLEYIDAGANLLDDMYNGIYHTKQYHEPDIDVVLHRAYEQGVRRVISLAGSIQESERLLDYCLSSQQDNTAMKRMMVQVFGTVGVHPTRCAQVFADETISSLSSSSSSSNDDSGGADVVDNSPQTVMVTTTPTTWTIKSDNLMQQVIQQLIDIANRGKETGCIVAIGECGLDYARLEFCSREIQKIGLLAQLHVAQVTALPLRGPPTTNMRSLYGKRIGVEIPWRLIISDYYYNIEKLSNLLHNVGALPSYVHHIL